MMEAAMKKLLVVDDDSSNRITLTLLLEDEGFEVAGAASSADARAILSPGGAAFDVVLLDQHLGDGLGTELVPAFRARMPAAKLVLISGSIDKRDRADGEFDAYIPKGIAFPELLEQLRVLIG